MIDGRVFDATVTQLAWEGNTVKGVAKVELLGTYDFEAVIDEATGKIDGTLSDKEEVMADLYGARAK